MKTKIVYVLISDSKDNYLEQTLLSIYSLKQIHPDSKITIITDLRTKDYLYNKKDILSKLVSEIITVNVPQSLTNLQKSRFIKTSIRSYIKGSFLFIDGDTLIVDKLNEIDNIDVDFAAVPDKHIPFLEHSWRFLIINSLKKIGLTNYNELNYYINSGVMFVKDNEITHKMFQEWHNNWIKSSKIGINSDQPSLTKALIENDIQVHILDGIWNCQITENGLKWLNKAKILHYFASMGKEYKNNEVLTLQNESIFQEIKHGEYSSIEKAYLSCKELFLPNITLIGKIESDYRASLFYKLNLKIYYSSSKVRKILNNISRIFLRLL